MGEKDFFQLIPVRQFDWQIEENSQRVIVLRPKYISKWAKKIMKPFSRESYFKIKLDTIGSQVWQACDGQNTVEQIFNQLKQAFPDESNLKERFTLFLKQLSREKFIIFLQKVDETSNPPEE